jgi:hypothetical protein
MNLVVILKRAKALARSQGRLGRSPAERSDDGTIALCAGSCIARSAIELYGDAASLELFDRAVLGAEKLTLLPAVFRKYGLSEATARYAVAQNDTRSSTDRLQWFLSLDAPLMPSA